MNRGVDASQMWDAVMQLICKQWWVQKRAIGVVVNCPIGKAQLGVIAFWIVFAFWLTIQEEDVVRPSHVHNAKDRGPPGPLCVQYAPNPP